MVLKSFRCGFCLSKDTYTHTQTDFPEDYCDPRCLGLITSIYISPSCSKSAHVAAHLVYKHDNYDMTTDNSCTNECCETCGYNAIMVKYK